MEAEFKINYSSSVKVNHEIIDIKKGVIFLESGRNSIEIYE